MPAPTPQAAVQAINEATFSRQVMASPLPVLVLFGAPTCAASRALRPLLQELAALHAGQLRIAAMNAVAAPFLAEQFGVAATPTLLLMRDGEVVTRVVGFLPAGLLRLLCEQIVTDTLPRDPFWSPTEATFEDIVLLPLLETWGFQVVRQAPCRAQRRGRIDVLVYDPPNVHPLTLFENKRQFMSAQALRQATNQAYTYARALQLPSFVVAAPSGMWISACTSTQAMEIRRVTSLELQQDPQIVPQILRGLGMGQGDRETR